MSLGPNSDQTSKVGKTQDGDKIYIETDGYFSPEGVNGFVNLTGQNLYDLLYTKGEKTTIANSAGVISTVNLPSEYGLIHFSVVAAASNASAWLTSGVRKYQEQILQMGADASVGSIFISLSGVSLVGTKFVDLSSISIQQSAASDGYILLRSYSDDEWTVVAHNGAVAQRSSS